MRRYIASLFLIAFLFSEAANAWQLIGTGVNYKEFPNVDSDGNNVLIAYAGYGVNQAQTNAWSDRLMLKSTLKNNEYGIKHVYSIRGPADVYYTGKEIQNSKLIAHLYGLLASKAQTMPKLIVILSHSSGTYVSDEFFAQLYNKIVAYPNDSIYKALRKRIVFYNLDGGTIPSRKDDAYINTLFTAINFVWASKGSLTSMNSAVMINAKNYYSKSLNIKSVEVVANKAQCTNSKCLHDAVIIDSPHNPQAFEVSSDYTTFSESREVQYAYLVSTANDLNLALSSKCSRK